MQDNVTVGTNYVYTGSVAHTSTCYGFCFKREQKKKAVHRMRRDARTHGQTAQFLTPRPRHTKIACGLLESFRPRGSVARIPSHNTPSCCTKKAQIKYTPNMSYAHSTAADQFAVDPGVIATQPARPQRPPTAVDQTHRRRQPAQTKKKLQRFPHLAWQENMPASSPCAQSTDATHSFGPEVHVVTMVKG